ncbi:glycosyltransferase [Paenibacillus sp. JX-17]|uniref:Glycosyltransferase n=1 Tax=Paenibacillus lacisoli TaxID=3064525 RepID=A0ABT9CEJ5_9BACL|nr:glycosyltransferase [Paenibacillus sp. JX-17]MDO7906983.1 glycosyltransferase [Paenibacillus sp. JX-17]
MKPTVSIIIPFYNCPYIDRAVASALEQTYDAVEILVIDDGSTSNADRLAPYRDRVHYLGKANGGTASALNHGIRYAGGDYIAWLSADDIFYPGKIENQLQFMLTHNALISHTNFDFINAESQVTSYAAGAVFAEPVAFASSFFNMNPVNGCTVMIKKEIFTHLGNFNESLRYTHDLDFWYRVVLSRVPFPYLNENLTAYRVHEGMGSQRYRPQIHEEWRAVQRVYDGAMRGLIRSMGGEA